MKLRLFVLMSLMMIAYNGRCGEFLSSHTQDAQSISDSLKVIAPKGYVLLSFDGARRALRAKADADSFGKMLAVKDSVIFFRELQVKIMLDRIAVQEASKAQYVADIRILKNKVLLKNIQLATVIVGYGLFLVTR